jgi:hypothetical protein
LPGSAWSIGDSVRLPDGRAGRLTELARIGADCEALAVVNSDKAEREEAVNDNLAGAELPLPYPVSVSA